MLDKLLRLKSRTHRTLDSIRKLQELMGYPDRRYPTVHVAGTNGKGSVCTKIAAAYKLLGKKTGLYTSPHIKHFSERIVINDIPIPTDTCETILKELFTKAHKLELSFFDVATMLAFEYFAREHVDIAIIETGLGGRWDATNIIDPILNVITTLGLDHTELLGNTIESIAHEKAGIIKGTTPVVIGPSISRSLIKPYSERIHQPIGTFNSYDQENRATAEMALNVLGVPICGTETRPRCRMERIKHPQKTIYLDAGHNPDGLKALFRSLDTVQPEVICAFSKEKDIAACMKIIAENASHMYLTQADTPRAAAPSHLAAELDKIGYRHHTAHETMASALSAASKSNQPLVICGTFYILDDALEYFNL